MVHLVLLTFANRLLKSSAQGGKSEEDQGDHTNPIFLKTLERWQTWGYPTAQYKLDLDIVCIF
jgi:hypothetical protein